MKKINSVLAGVCLCGISLVGITGCSLADSEKSAIDKLVNNVDNMVEVFDKQNKKLNTDEAAKLCALAQNRLESRLYDKIKSTESYKEYSGRFDSNIVNKNADLITYFNNDVNFKYFVQYRNTDKDLSKFSGGLLDKSNKKTYWLSENGKEDAGEYSSLFFEETDINYHLKDFQVFEKIEAGEISNIEFSEGNYKIKLIKSKKDKLAENIHKKRTSEITYLISTQGDFEEISVLTVDEFYPNTEYKIPNELMSYHYTLNLDYSDTNYEEINKIIKDLK